MEGFNILDTHNIKKETTKPNETNIQENCEEHSYKLPPATETLISCQLNSVLSHGKHYQGNWVEEITEREGHSPSPVFGIQSMS